MTVEEYDARTLARARELTELHTTEDMLMWIYANHGSTIIRSDDPLSIRAYIHGVTKVTLAELVWRLERIPAGSRG